MTSPYPAASTRLRKRSSVEQLQRDSLLQSPEQQFSPFTPTDSPTLRPSQSNRSQSQQTSTKLHKPHLRQSVSFVAGKRSLMDNITPPRSEASSSSPRQRYSDEGNGPVKVFRKKSGFSNFVNSLVGSPRRPPISAPENPVHVTHVGYNTDTGEFTVWEYPG